MLEINLEYNIVSMNFTYKFDTDANQQTNYEKCLIQIKLKGPLNPNYLKRKTADIV